MRTRAFSFLISWSSGPSEASRHFSQDRQLRAKFFVAQPSWLRSRWASLLPFRILIEVQQARNPLAIQARWLCYYRAANARRGWLGVCSPPFEVASATGCAGAVSFT